MIQDFVFSNIIIISVLMLISSLLLGVMIWVKNTISIFPTIDRRLGPAQAIGTGMSQIKEVRVIDMGGKKEGESALAGLATLPVETVFDLIQKAKALGLDLTDLARKAGFDVK